MSTRVGSLFTGSGMLDEAVRAVLGGEVAWHAEHEPATETNPRPTQAAARLLAYRYPGVPNLGDITTVDWTAVERVDVLTGGFPCQDVSHAGKRAGLKAGTRSGLWARMCDAIDALRPPLVVAENVRGLLSAEADSAVEPCTGCVGDRPGVSLRALGRVLADLADLGYDARWHGLRAADVGAPHERFRVFILATDTTGNAWGFLNGDGRTVADAERVGRDGWSHDARWGTVGRVAATGAGAGATADTDDRRYAAVMAGGTSTGQPEPARDPAPTADAAHVGHELGGRARDGRDRSPHSRCCHDGCSGIHETVAFCDGRHHCTPADSSGYGRDEGWPEPARIIRGSDAAECGATAAYMGRAGRGVRPAPSGMGELRTTRVLTEVSWGQYEPAIRRWESVLGRPAPAPTEPGPRGGQRLSPRLTEWMMGWPEGWVTDVPGITRNEALRICGNGVVPQQATAALRILLDAGECAA